MAKGAKERCRVHAARIVRIPVARDLSGFTHYKQPWGEGGFGPCVCVYPLAPNTAHFLALTLKSSSAFGCGPWSINCDSQLAPNQCSVATHMTLLRDAHC